MYKTIPRQGTARARPAVNYNKKIMRKPAKRSRFTEGVRDFLVLFMNTSSIHGVRYLVCYSIQPIERLMWFAAIALAVWGAVTVSLTTWTRFQNNPTVVTMDHNYKDWNTTFPSITICPEPKYDENSLERIINKLFPEVKDKENVTKFIKEFSMATFGHFTFNTSTEINLLPSSYWKLLWKITFIFLYNVSNSNIDAYNQNELNPVMTEDGICYSYNSITTVYNNPKNWEMNEWKYLRGAKIFEGSPLDGDIFAQVMNMNAGYRLYILDPTEFPDAILPGLKGDNNSYKTLDLTALSIVSTEEVESLSIQQRKCRLPHESDLMTSPAYSYNLCRMECRMKECFRLCKCVPHFYRPTESYPVCDVKGMECLHNNSVLLKRMIDPDTGQKIPCNCLQLCNEVNYMVDNDNTMAWTLGTNLKWGLIKYPKFRLKRIILFGQTELFVGIGSAAGLFLGCSLLSFAEIVYFFTLRLFWFLLSRTKDRI